MASAFLGSKLLDSSVAHDEFLDLTGDGHRELIHDQDMLGDLVIGNLFVAVIPDFVNLHGRSIT